jgi:hypothetical protein
MQKFGADAIIETDTARDFLHVSTYLLAKIGNLVDKRNLGR